MGHIEGSSHPTATKLYLGDELPERIKAELTKLGPILELEVVREPEGSRTEGGVTLAN